LSFCFFGNKAETKLSSALPDGWKFSLARGVKSAKSVLMILKELNFCFFQNTSYALSSLSEKIALLFEQLFWLYCALILSLIPRVDRASF